MNIRQVHPDNTIDLGHEGHHFTCALVDFASPTLPGGAANAVVLGSPQLACTDPGCSYTCRTFFPIDGDAEAQRVHAHYRHAIGRHKTMKLAAQAVRDAVREAGGEPRISPSEFGEE